MFNILFGLIIAAALIAVEYILCTRLRSALWGSIIPIVALISSVLMFASGKIPLERNYIFPFFIANTLLLSEWAAGRDKYNKIKNAEMEKMKARDI